MTTKDYTKSTKANRRGSKRAYTSPSTEDQFRSATARVESTNARARSAQIRSQTANDRACTPIKKPSDIDAAEMEREAKKAESEAHMADNKAKKAEIEAQRAVIEAEAYEYRAKIEADRAEECARQAATQAETWAKYIASKAEAEVKRTLANAAAKEAKSKGGESSKEAAKARKEAYNAESEAKKAKLIADKTAAATEAKVKHINAASQAQSSAKTWRTEAEERQAEAKARKAEAKARRAEAKASRKGDKLKADAKKAEALAKKAEALAIKAKIDFTKIERKVKAQAKAKKTLNGPLPPEDRLPERRARCSEKKHLSQPGLLNQIREVFLQIPGTSQRTRKGQPEVSICDCLMSGFAIFSLKYPSLLQFDQDSKEGGCIHHNLQTLYQIQDVPCDTYMRERLDVIDPNALRPAFTSLFSALQRGKELEEYLFYDNYYLLSGDGTGYFSSKCVYCKDCCKKEHQDGSVTYYHQMMSAAIVHPNHSTVIPLCPEPIIKTDGTTKNDCERNASERLYKHIRREHPHLQLIVTEDALGSNGPHIRLLQELNMRYIIVVKPEGNKYIFDFLKGVERQEATYCDNNFKYKIQFKNEIPLNESHPDLKVNFIEVWVYDSEGNQQYHNTWITDIPVTITNAYCLFKGGRAKWKIENETFNTLKNQGYHFEHNYGHGKQHLSTIFALLMMLAFLIDQILQSCCGLFQMAWGKTESKIRLWGKLRAYFTTMFIDSWESLWRAIICGYAGWLNMPPDTS
jgi:hypothetical protein